jgi:hypothetical protein
MTKKEETIRPGNRREARRIVDVDAVPAIPAPTVVWHPSVPLEKLISDFAEYQHAIIVS